MDFFSILHALGILAHATALTPENPVWDGLSDDDRKAVLSGESVVLKAPVAGSAWPEVTVIRRVEGREIEGAGIFFDYEIAHEYVPNLESSVLVAEPSVRRDQVKYFLNLAWPLPNEDYTLEYFADALSRKATSDRPADRVFGMDWKMIRSKKMKKIEGYIRFEPMPKSIDGGGVEPGAFLLTYFNRVVPGYNGAGLAESAGIHLITDTVDGFVEQMEKERSSEEGRKKLETQVANLEEVLSHEDDSIRKRAERKYRHAKTDCDHVR